MKRLTGSLLTVLAVLSGASAFAQSRHAPELWEADHWLGCYELTVGSHKPSEVLRGIFGTLPDSLEIGELGLIQPTHPDPKHAPYLKRSGWMKSAEEGEFLIFWTDEFLFGAASIRLPFDTQGVSREGTLFVFGLDPEGPELPVLLKTVPCPGESNR